MVATVVKLEMKNHAFSVLSTVLTMKLGTESVKITITVICLSKIYFSIREKTFFQAQNADMMEVIVAWI